MEKYHITLKISRGCYSYLQPERNKPITGRQLGTLYEEKYLLQLFKENAEEKERLLNQKKEAQNTYRRYYDYQKELDNVCSNVGMILGQTHNRQPEKYKSTDIS